MNRLCILTMLLLPVVSTDLLAEAPGTITGRVVGRENQQPLVGADVVLQGTVLGTSTDANGRFSLKHVPAGSYSLSISIVGYERVIVRDVRVGEGRVSELSIELSQSAIQTEPVIVTASRREQSLQEVPVSVSVLDARELSYRNSITIEDGLRHVPGVNMTEGQVNIRGSTGYSRGVGTRVLLLVDGLPMLSGDTGEIIWESLPVYQIDRVEVVKGAGSALYGSSALGGVINILTKEVRDPPETRIRMYGGLYEKPKYPQWRWTNASRFLNGLTASHSRRFDDVSLFVGASRTADEGFKRNDSWRRYNGSVLAAYNLSPFESLSFLFSLLNQRRGNFLYWKSLDSALVPEDDQLRQRVESTRWSLGSSFKKIISDEFYYNIKATWYRTKWEDNIAGDLDQDGNNSRADFFNGEVQGTYHVSGNHTVTAGVYGSFNRVSADVIFGKHSGYGAAAYVQDEMTLNPDVLIAAGVRYDLQKLEEIETIGQLNPKVGFTYNPDGHTTVRASVGRGFRAPSVAEVFTTTEAGGVTVLPNPNLRSERSWSFEVGASRTLSDNLYAQLSLFQNEFWDLIEPTFGTDFKVRFQNVTRARVQGFEVGVKTSLFQNAVLIDLGYTYMYPRDVAKQDMLKYRPRHLLYVTNKVQFEYIQLGIDQRFLSKVERIDDELVRFGIVTQGDKRVPILVTDVRLSVDWGFVEMPFVSAFHVNNLFGYHYVELIGNLAPIRNYVLTLEAVL